MTQAESTVRPDVVTTGEWLLQPIGRAINGGPTHYAHSIERGVDLADPEYAQLLGPEAEDLGTLYQGRPARFWGSTWSTTGGRAKNKAIDSIRPGDEVLFISEKKVIARARVVLAFRNRALAEKIWGLDKLGRAWEHMYAVDDVVETDLLVSELTGELEWRKSWVQGLSRQVGDKATRIDALLGRELAVVPGQRSTGPDRRATGSGLDQQALLQAITALRTDTAPDGPARQKPLALLWAVGRLTAGRERMTPWDEFENEVGPLLDEFGGAGEARTPECPFWHLRNSRLWEVQGVDVDGAAPSPGALSAAGARAGLSSDAARLLKRARTRARAVSRLMSEHFDSTEVDKTALLERTGLGGYLSASGEGRDDSSGPGPVGRRPSTVSRPDRDRDLPAQVKELYGHRCQVCDEVLETRDGLISEAAHIQGLGRPHDGTDTLDNMLCLCPNHHRQFDRFGLYIDEDWSVHLTGTGERRWERLRINPEHVISPEFVAYHRELCLRPW
ncbi:HNH endonuclease [Streptomyces lichenis]|uniref:HNH endonuclease n=1 Tax=Streptomyces lichenis TaxID=2306967 RepID=A0ABT0I7Y0_9ACTN|nr:HNH endonuclease [Streptomyces lichenis]MCK8677437.1 HNH endonuclease [Streptomyces lichenis]